MNFSETENQGLIFNTLLYTTDWQISDISDFQIINDHILKSLDKPKEDIKSSYSIICLPLWNSSHAATNKASLPTTHSFTFLPHSLSSYRFKLSDFKQEFREDIVRKILGLKFPKIPDSILRDEYNLFTYSYEDENSNKKKIWTRLDIEHDRQYLLAEKRKEEKSTARKLKLNKVQDTLLVLNYLEDPLPIIEGEAA